MKILFYSHTAKVSGAENILLLLIKKLNRKQYQASAICSGEGPLTGRLEELDVACTTTPELIARFTLNPFKLIGYLKSLAATIAALRTCIKSNKPDLIHANSIRAGIVATAASFRSRIPVFWHLQDELGTHPLSTLIRLFVLSSKRIRLIAASGATLKSFRGRLLSIFGRTIPARVIHNVVDASVFELPLEKRKQERRKLGAKQDDFLIGTIGQITPRKGQLELIRAFAGCAKTCKNARLLIIGSPMFNADHDYLQELTQETERLGVSDTVSFLGFRKDIPELLSALDTVIINSKSEAFVVVGVEALAAGVPVIATDVGGIREMLVHGENGLIVSFGDAEALESSILRLADDKDLCVDFMRRGRHIVRSRLNSDVFIQNVEAFFDAGYSDPRLKQIQQMKEAESNA